MRRLETRDRRQTLPPKEVSARGKRKHTAAEVLQEGIFLLRIRDNGPAQRRCVVELFRRQGMP